MASSYSNCSSSILIHLLILLTMATLIVAWPAESGSPACHDSCGNITNIRFPFSVISNLTSTLDPSFCPSTYMDNPYLQLFCNQTEGKLYALPHPVYNESGLTRLEVISIRNESLIVRLATEDMGIAQMSSSDGEKCRGSGLTKILLPPVGIGPYVVSNENKLGTFGCSTGFLGTTDVIDRTLNYTLLDYSDHVAVGGCSVLLPDNRNNTQCGNRTCCVASLPPASDLRLRFAYYYTMYSLQVLRLELASFPECTSCSDNYAALFHPEFTDFDTRSFLIKILWALPVFMDNATDYAMSDIELNQTIEGNPASYACTGNGTSDFVPVPEVPGYLCKCKDGFEGDGYTNGTGCTNVDECAAPSKHSCVSDATCKDTFGSYICTCHSRFYVGDGRQDGSGCKLSPYIHKIIFTLLACLGLLLITLIIIVLLMFWTKKMKKKNFIQNGGLQLQEFMKTKGHEHTFPRIFTGSELKVATNNYAEDMKISRGGFGAVYKGKLEMGKLVAIKKALVPGDGDNKEFLNEVMILTQIHHKHIVKLLGCCLETKTPLLVYEYASNGTLGDHLHQTSKNGYMMGWYRRLAVATQTVEALSYLHRAASPPILHRDVKATNILLDDNWEAKVGDFGVSRLVPHGDQHVSTVVQGTLGYLDPEYFQTLQLTDKSDVYSLGVMLVELITGLKPVDNLYRDPQFSNLALLFIHHIREGTVEEIIDPRLEMDIDSVSISHEQAWRIRSSILSVASIAHRCLAIRGHDRPSMMEVEHQLHGNSRELHDMAIGGAPYESVALLEGCEVGAVVMENNAYVIQCHSTLSMGDS